MERDNLSGYEKIVSGGNILKKIPVPFHEFRTLTVINNPHVDRNERVGAIKTMIYYGYTEQEIIDIISSYGVWDMSVSVSAIRKLYKERKHINNYAVGTLSNHTSKTNRFPLSNINDINSLISHFWKSALCVNRLSISDRLDKAPWEYHKLGYHVLPKASKDCNCRLCKDREHDKKGKHPSLRTWKEYQYRQPTNKEIDLWDWNNGLCLLATDRHSYLDIDQKYGGVINTHAEKTPRGGVHMFGLGQCKSINIQGVGEIKGFGSLIIAYPTPGYTLI